MVCGVWGRVEGSGDVGFVSGVRWVVGSIQELDGGSLGTVEIYTYASDKGTEG